MGSEMCIGDMIGGSYLGVMARNRGGRRSYLSGVAGGVDRRIGYALKVRVQDEPPVLVLDPGGGETEVGESRLAPGLSRIHS